MARVRRTPRQAVNHTAPTPSNKNRQTLQPGHIGLRAITGQNATPAHIRRHLAKQSAPAEQSSWASQRV